MILYLVQLSKLAPREDNPEPRAWLHPLTPHVQTVVSPYNVSVVHRSRYRYNVFGIPPKHQGSPLNGLLKPNWLKIGVLVLLGNKPS